MNDSAKLKSESNTRLQGNNCSRVIKQLKNHSYSVNQTTVLHPVQLSNYLDSRGIQTRPYLIDQ